MPPSPSDDPFADLFGNLPDPRTRELKSSGEDAAAGGPRSGAPAASSEPTPPTGADGAPLSRRAAREAAQRSATGPSPVAPAPAPPAPANPGGTAAPAPANANAGGPPTEPLQIDPDDQPWIFIAAAQATGTPYSRTGSAAPRPQAAPAPAPASSGAPTATLEDLFTGTGSVDEIGVVPPPKNKRKRRIGGWIALGVVLLILGGLAAGTWYVWTTYEDQIREVMGWEEPKDYEAGLASGEALITVESGDTGWPISQKLYEAGVTKTPEAFYDFLIEEGRNPPFEPGVFRLQQKMTSTAALDALLDPANRMENTAQLREGLTVAQSVELLAEGTGIPVEEFQAAVATPATYGVAGDSLEGWLFPATYTFAPDATAPQIIQTMVDRTVQSLDQAGVPVDDRHRVLTIAAIIQREARFEQDFYKVSRVIQNRLDPGNEETFGLLQMDSTAQYGYGEMHDGTVSTSADAQYDDNPWNTYVHPGLPIGPIANPGDVAIDAAMNPADGDWLYFVTVNLNTGETEFTSNLADHNRAREKWIAWCEDNPDAGC